MKIRNGFVSNSSSSSFVILKKHLSNEQIEQIREHYSIARDMCKQGTNLEYMYGYDDCWDINETSQTIEGSTHMDNFDMYSYMKYFVSVNMDIVSWND